MRSAKEIERDIVDTEFQKKRLVEELRKKNAQFREAPPVVCSCGSRIWNVRASFNPNKLMAFESRSLWLVCSKCDQTMEIPVQSHWG